MSVTFSGASLRATDEFGEVMWVEAPDELEVNMANGNAAQVCAALGVSLAPDWCGDMDADDFLGRVLVALAVAPADPGMPSYELLPGDADRPAWAGDATVIQGARPPGYLQERLEQLHALALWCRENGKFVSWG